MAARPQPKPLPLAYRWLPPEFHAAYGLPDGQAELDIDDYSGWEDWPLRDDDDAEDPDANWGWYTVVFFPQYEIKNGHLIVHVMRGHDGDIYSACSADVKDRAALEEMRQLYGHKMWHEHNVDYFKWVAEKGEDPLDWVTHWYTPETYTTTWLVGVKEEGGRFKFWKASGIRNEPPSPPPTEDFRAVPESVREYLRMDDQGYLAVTVEEMEAAPEVRRKEDHWLVTLETKEKQYDDALLVAALKQSAAAEAVKQAREAKKAKGGIV